MIVISLLRKGAFKRLVISTSNECYLAVLQVFESTDDVVDYNVAELDRNFNPIDKYLSDTHGFSKWKPINKE